MHLSKHCRPLRLLAAAIMWGQIPQLALAFQARTVAASTTVRKQSERPATPFVQTTATLFSSKTRDTFLSLRAGGSENGDPGNDEDGPQILESIGVLAQPVVWVSLYNVATTGGGLPAGPFGLVGAVEGLAYLVMVGFAGAAFFGGGSSSSLAKKLSQATLLVGILTLAKLVGDQGCIPNAKPILDYSAYLPVCNAEQTPGLFGGS